MTDHTEILKMIETVDPSDAARLDEIDQTVALYLGYELAKKAPKHFVLCKPWPQFTRSRDALKAIRPEGWIMGICFKIQRNGYCAGMYKLSAENDVAEEHSEPLPTEELAELHAIIQAIAYQRCPLTF